MNNFLKYCVIPIVLFFNTDGLGLAINRNNKQGMVFLSPNELLTDIRLASWKYCVVESNDDSSYHMYHVKTDTADINDEYNTIVNSKKWNSIHVGKRWEALGYPQLNDKKVWLRLRFFVPQELKGRNIGFFCTAADDAVDVLLNGEHLHHAEYIWGARIADPVNVVFNPSNIQFGKENVLMIRISDLAKARGGGLLGNVFLYNTLPYSRTAEGGIELSDKGDGSYIVSLHLGDALLSKGEQYHFTADELRRMEIPSYIMREDELILVAPYFPEQLKQSPLRVNLENVSPMKSRGSLSVKPLHEIPHGAGQYELISIPLEIGATYSNPFDQKQIKVQAIIETPSGKTEEISAFFKQEFAPVSVGEEEEILLPLKDCPWQINYRPREVGKYSIQFLAQDCNDMVKSDLYSFNVTPSTEKGFLKVSKKDPMYFDFDNGESYYGIGPSGWHRNSNYIFGGNTRWISTKILDDYYKKKAASGSNFDYLLVEFFGRLYTKGGYMDQHVAWKIEHRIRLLEELGIYWMTCYDDMRRSTVYGLNSLPYSEAQGGPCKSIPELYFNPKSLEMQQEHIRYFVSRVSDSPAIMAWSFGDEWQAGMDFSVSMIRSWIKRLHEYVKTIDIYEHPHVIMEDTTSIVNGGDFILLPDWYFKKYTDAVSLTTEQMKTYAAFNCPIVNPEGGMVEWTKPEDKYGPRHSGYYLMGERWKFPEAISFHNHLWISLFTKAAVGGTEWLGQFIVQKDQLYHATAIKNFLEGEFMSRNRWQTVPPSLSNTGLEGYALQADMQTWVWVHNKKYIWVDAGHYEQKPPVISGCIIKIPVSKKGNYLLEVWDTHSGKIVSKSYTLVETNELIYVLPPVNKDVALKAVYIEK